jgi:hypothetical protein
VDALVDDRLDAHIFKDVFDRPVERDAVLVVFNKLGLLLGDQRVLLEDKFFVELD